MRLTPGQRLAFARAGSPPFMRPIGYARRPPRRQVVARRPLGRAIHHVTPVRPPAPPIPSAIVSGLNTVGDVLGSPVPIGSILGAMASIGDSLVGAPSDEQLLAAGYRPGVMQKQLAGELDQSLA